MQLHSARSSAQNSHSAVLTIQEVSRAGLGLLLHWSKIKKMKNHSRHPQCSECSCSRVKVIDWFFTAKQTTWTNSLCFHEWINKLTLKDNTVSYFVHTWRTLPPFFKQSSGGQIFLWEQLVYSVMGKKRMFLYYYLINILKSLNLFSKTRVAL